ncbi:hypothetical protein BJY16_008585 [Actinoplanes octamycinicus]|uniref:Uncharacterized protein n=1 Tax=Actinoplanes octamycinicus TaxID=135948 RepID=A0A7W7MCH5_9ACTN|nr:hypothetical protein [Actinoplanes octamycinicus]
MPSVGCGGPVSTPFPLPRCRLWAAAGPSQHHSRCRDAVCGLRRARLNTIPAAAMPSVGCGGPVSTPFPLPRCRLWAAAGPSQHHSRCRDAVCGLRRARLNTIPAAAMPSVGCGGPVSTPFPLPRCRLWAAAGPSQHHSRCRDAVRRLRRARLNTIPAAAMPSAGVRMSYPVRLGAPWRSAREARPPRGRGAARAGPLPVTVSPTTSSGATRQPPRPAADPRDARVATCPVAGCGPAPSSAAGGHDARSGKRGPRDACVATCPVAGCGPAPSSAAGGHDARGGKRGPHDARVATCPVADCGPAPSPAAGGHDARSGKRGPHDACGDAPCGWLRACAATSSGPARHALRSGVVVASRADWHGTRSRTEKWRSEAEADLGRAGGRAVFVAERAVRGRCRSGGVGEGWARWRFRGGGWRGGMGQVAFRGGGGGMGQVAFSRRGRTAAGTGAPAGV